ncbi:MAG: FtsX-like permease family protein [Bacteroidetes bacterium]|nr:FtsX-like permease family protein [Bacteroidota bacterium]
MFKFFFNVVIRNFFKQKLNSFINLLGLSLGIATGFLILTHVRDEISYDKFFPKSDRLFRVTNTAHYGDQVRNWAPTAPVLADEMVKSFPEIEMATHFRQDFSTVLTYQPEEGEKKSFEENWGFFTDSIALKMFDIEFIQGNPLSALRDVNSIIITPFIARKYFGDEDPMGKTLLYQSQLPLKVTGVFKEIPHNSHLKIDFLITFASFRNLLINMGYEGLYYTRTWAGVYTYVQLWDMDQKKDVESKMLDFQMEYYQFDGTPEEMKSERIFSLQPITQIHLYSNLEQEISRNGNIVYIIVFTISAIFILFIAGVNFVNITTSHSFKRMKEVGIRKVTGAFKGQLIRQFLGEALLMVFIAGLLGILFIDFLIPLYNQLSGKLITLSQVFSPINIIVMSGIIILVGLLSGIYPALFVSSFDPVISIKGIKDPKSKANRIRKSLLVVQFVLAGFMIFSTFIIYLQMEYFHTKEMGFDQENLIAIKTNGDLAEFAINEPEALKNEITGHSSVISASIASNLPGETYSVEGLRPDSLPDDTELPSMRFMRSDKDYLTTLGLELIEGKDFSDVPSLRHGYILNETAVNALNLTNPVGRKGSSTFGGDGEIIGVIKDFHFASLHSLIEPLVIEYLNTEEGRQIGIGNILVRIQPGQDEVAMKHLEETVKELVPEAVFSYEFVESYLSSLYKDEKNVLDLFKAFSLLSIFIACLGLFGISAFTAQLRTKEIGIRKTFGANTISITMLVSREFLIYVLLSLIIAIPLGLHFMSKWLQNFAFHIRIQWWVILLSAIITLFIALLAIGYQAVKAAVGRPADALRYE